MYKAVRMFNYKDGLGLEQEALKGVCEVEEHVCSTEDDIIKYCQDADAVMGIFEPLTAWDTIMWIWRPPRPAASPSPTCAVPSPLMWQTT